MIKRTLYFGNPAYLSMRNEQLVIGIPSADGMDTNIGNTIPIEDIGVIILDHKQITITHGLLEQLLENNCAVITCDSLHLPVGYLLPLAGNKTQTERFKFQLEASEPLKKNLWQQTIEAKIKNQAALLKQNGNDITNLLYWAKSVKSGDTSNHEARAAAVYWSIIFQDYIPDFRRGRDGEEPNNLLNYGYAILRAIAARALVASGMLPTLGIFHRNRYNAYCLADDIMEPYRPYVDAIVLDWVKKNNGNYELTKDAKIALFNIATCDVVIENERSPLMVGISRTTTSLVRCFEGVQRKLAYPEFL